VIKLARQGWKADEIAKVVKLGRSEEELIFEARDKSKPVPKHPVSKFERGAPFSWIIFEAIRLLALFFTLWYKICDYERQTASAAHQQ
jgi:hypothetical protein